MSEFVVMMCGVLAMVFGVFGGSLIANEAAGGYTVGVVFLTLAITATIAVVVALLRAVVLWVWWVNEMAGDGAYYYDCIREELDALGARISALETKKKKVKNERK